ncbi:NifU family protein [Actinoplanes sp. NPDC049316]|uniref:NifU family protein n=1 Tax=Actinoplanes sp. NPDC049316 TaxID=3154727 RepID=UPI0034320DA1
MIPIHPQACPGRPERLRWITPAGVLAFTGVPDSVPGALATLLRDGTLAAVSVEAAAVVTDLAAGRSWSRDGSRVRSALHEALVDPDGWTAAAPGDPDEPLRAAAAALIGGRAGELALSHGGGLELVDVHDGVVTVRMSGACNGCPAAGITLRHRLEDELRRRCPGVRRVVAGA